MNRCNASLSRASVRRHLLATLGAMALWAGPLSAHAQAMVRNFPPLAERGTMVVTYPPIIQLNGKEDRLTPGARIHGANNMLVLSGSIVGQSVVVNYVRDPMGLVHEVWILTPQEAALKLPTQR